MLHGGSRKQVGHGPGQPSDAGDGIAELPGTACKCSRP